MSSDQSGEVDTLGGGWVRVQDMCSDALLRKTGRLARLARLATVYANY